MWCYQSSSRGSSLSKDENNGLYPEFRVPRLIASLSELGSPRPWLFVGCKGIPVCCYSWDVANPKAVVVLVHGYGAHCMFEWLHSVPPESETEPEPEEPVTESPTKDFHSSTSLHEEVGSSWNCCRPAATPADATPESDGLSEGGASRASLSRSESMAPLKGTDAADALKKPFALQREEKTPAVPKAATVTQVTSAVSEKPADSTAPRLTYAGSWAQRFVSRGWRVVGIDLQSHGASHGWDGTSCQVQAFDDFAQDIKTLLESLANQSSLPIFLVGISMGGCAAVRAAQLLSKAGMLGKAHPSAPKQRKEGKRGHQEPEEIEQQQTETPLQSQTAGTSEGTESTASTQRGSVMGKGRKSLMKDSQLEGVDELTGTPDVAESSIAAAAAAIGASHRVIRQKPVPLAGLVLLSPLLDLPQVDGGAVTCMGTSFMNALKSWFPHCGVVNRPRNDMFPEVDLLFSQDENTFKGKCRINIGMEMQAGVKAAQADAHWLLRPIMRDANEPISISDWTKLLHRQIEENEAEERKALRLERTQGLQRPGKRKGKHLMSEERKLLMADGEDMPSAQHLSVLVVQSLDDTIVPPLGSVRFFEKLGGRAMVPEPWASILRGERREEREAIRAARAKGQEKAEELGESTEEESELGHQHSASFEAELLEQAASHLERLANEDLKEAEIATRKAEVAAGEGDVSAEDQIRSAVEAVELATAMLERASTLDKLAAKAEASLPENKMSLAARFASLKVAANGDEGIPNTAEPQTDKDSACDGNETGKETVTSEMGHTTAQTEVLPDDQSPEDPQPPSDEAQAKGTCCASCCACCAAETDGSAATSTKKKGRKKSAPKETGGLLSSCFACGCGDDRKERPPTLHGLYWKRKRWGRITGMILDKHGCLVDAEDANALMEEVRATGFEPFPQLQTRVADDTTDEEDIKEETRLNSEDGQKFTRITNTAAEGALQLWLLRGNCHMLTKEPGNEELQADIISRFLEPTLKRLADEPKAAAH